MPLSEAPAYHADIRPASLETEPLPSTVAFDFTAAAKRVSPSVVSVDRINQTRRFFDGAMVERETGEGSGVILSADGIVVTNYHVVQRAEKVRVRLADRRSVDAEVLGHDERSDLAVLRIKATGLKPIEVANSANVQVGQWVMAIGNPLGFDNTVSVGVVSSLKRNLPIGRQGLVDAIQTDAAINPGNSGGALADAQGRLIGINTAIASSTGQSVGIGFAIPVDRVRRIVDDIIKVGYPRYAGLGLQYDSRDESALAIPQVRQRLAELAGARPESVPTRGIIVEEATGPAAAAGMQRFDVLLEVEGETIETTFDLNRALVPRRPGDTVRVKFWSKGQTKNATVRLQEIRPQA